MFNKSNHISKTNNVETPPPDYIHSSITKSSRRYKTPSIGLFGAYNTNKNHKKLAHKLMMQQNMTNEFISKEFLKNISQVVDQKFAYDSWYAQKQNMV